ncbi:TPA: hypothetical protein ACH3X1_003871 [Trebouxia sp. C0004]
MLHELVHNVQGPHNAVFYKLLDEITEECEGFMAKGIAGSGAGFDAPSVGRLGGRGPVPIHNPPSHQLKSLALKAAEARSKKQAVMPSGPRKLGGDLSLLKGLTPAQAAARAAERRARDNVWCPCDHGTDLGYNSDDDVIILDGPQQAGQTPATQQAQTATKPGSSHAKQQPAGPVMHQGTVANAAAVTVRVRYSHEAASLQPTSATTGHSGPEAPRAADRAPTEAEKIQDRQTALGLGRSPPELVSLAKQQQQQHNDQQRLRADPACTSCSSMPTKQFLGDNDLVDLTADDINMMSAQGPISKRMRLLQSKASGSQAQLCNMTNTGRGTGSLQDSGHLQIDSVCNRPANQWACETCTLLNADSSLQCSVCGQIRPPQSWPTQLEDVDASACEPKHQSQSMKVQQLNHAKVPNETGSGRWTCKFCSLFSASAQTHCSVCGQWRYSHSPPLYASRPTL